VHASAFRARHSMSSHVDDDEPATANATALVDESFLLRVLRDIVECRILPSRSAEKDGEHATQLDEHLERRMEALWDLCVDAGTADFVARHRGVAVLAEAAERAQGEGRVAEVCFGTLANICAHRALVLSALAASSDLHDLLRAILRGLRTQDGLSVLQALRVTCALLCGPLAEACADLWSEVAISCYIFALEHSLRWEVVQHACDALCQILVLESSAGKCLLPSTHRERLPAMLAARSMELASAIAGEVSEAEGDPEAALLSALRLTESFLTVAACPSADVLPLGRAVCCTLASGNQPEVLVAALEVLAAIFENCEVELPSPESKTTMLQGSTGGPSDKHCVAMDQLRIQVESFCGSTPGLAEKLALLLEDTDASEIGGIAMVLLQHVPRAEAAEHRQLFAEAAAAALHPPGGAAPEALAGVSPRFLQFLKESPEEEPQ